MNQKLNFELVRNFFLAASGVALVLIPCDVLALSFVPAGTFRVAKMQTTAYSFEEAGESTEAYSQAVASTRALGKLAAGLSLSPLAGSIDDILGQLRLKGIFSLGGRDAIVEDVQESKTVFLKEGDKYKSLAVKAVGEESLVFTDGVNEREMKIAPEARSK